MGRQVLTALWSLLLVCANGEESKTVNVTVRDNDSAESAPQLYTDVTSAIYASNAPYVAYRYGAARDPVNSASHFIPVKEESFIVSSQAGVLKDSYGNKFVETPQTVAYRTAFPQQYVRLQDLPVHLSQPLTAEPGLHYPNFSHGGPARLSAVTPTPIIRYGNPSQHQIYAGNIKSSPPHQGSYNFRSPQQQSTNSKIVYSNQPSIHYGNPKKFERLEQQPVNPQAAHSNNAQLQSIPAKQVAANKNVKKTTFLVASNQPLPLLNLNLLQPLTFANPIVPQVQHFLPKITYPLPGLESHKQHNEFVIQKTKSYDTGIMKNEPKDHNDNADDDDEDDDNDDVPPPPTPSKKLAEHDNSHKTKHTEDSKPLVIVHGDRGGPEYSYEIRSPSYKETYNEQVVNYGNKGEKEPVHYTYNKKSMKKPVSYSVTTSSNSKDPTKDVYIEVHNYGPEQTIYTKKPAKINHEQENERSPGNTNANESGEDYSRESDESGEKTDNYNSESDENEDHHKTDPKHFSQGRHYDSPRDHTSHHEPPRHYTNHGSYHNSPRHHSSHEVSSGQIPSHQLKPEHREAQYIAGPINVRTHDAHSPQYSQPIKVPVQNSPPQEESLSPHFYEEDIRILPTHATNSAIHNHPHQQHQNQQGNHNGQDYGNLHSKNQGSQRPGKIMYHHQSNTHQSHASQKSNAQVTNHHRQSPSSSPPQQYHREQQYIHQVPQQHNHQVPQQQNNQVPQQHNYQVPQQHNHQVPQQHNHQVPQQHNHQVTQQHNHQVPQQHNNQVPQQHNHQVPQLNNHQVPQQHNHQVPHHEEKRHHHEAAQPTPHYDSSPHVVEKSRKIIIQEETPDEMHSHREQMIAEMVDQEENNEEDFEKAYKEAAFGFPGYERNSEEIEKDIYNPDNYGVPKDDEYDFENPPFQQYQEKDDQFPKSARMSYKGARDDIKEDYMLDYSVSKPESLLDRHKSKANYYKLFKKQRPSVYYVQEPEKKQKKSESYTLDPNLFGFQVYPKQKKQNYFAQYKKAPQYEYDYSKEAPRDSYAFASGPSRKAKTLFVEPQFQYGFEPISLPTLLDSELSAMASNDSPESDKAGTRKKIYKENWYIKKTSTSKNKPAS